MLIDIEAKHVWNLLFSRYENTTKVSVREELSPSLSRKHKSELLHAGGEFAVKKMEPGRIELHLNQPSQSSTADLKGVRATFCATVCDPFLYKLVLAWENLGDQERNCIIAVANTFIEATQNKSRHTSSSTPAVGSENSESAGAANVEDIDDWEVLQ